MTLLPRVRALLRAHLDLLAWWWLLVCAQPLVPATHALSRTDLLPWMAVALSGAVALRGGDPGDGPHPQLRPWRNATLGAIGRVGAMLVPIAVLAVVEYAREPGPASGRAAAGLVAALLLTRRVALDDGRTAWRPPGRESLLFAAALLAVLVPAVGIGWMADGARPDGAVTPAGRWLADHDRHGLLIPASGAGFVGLAFTAVRLHGARPEHRWQRMAAGRRDGAPWQPPLYPMLLAAIGPAAGWMAVRTVVDRVGGGTDFGFAYAAALHVVVWAAVLWRRRAPVGMLCVLREMVPVGGRDAQGADAFSQPPEGALRLHPLDVRPTLRFHVWVVPVQQARVGELDDPIQPLFSRAPVRVGTSVLGEASFALDPVTRRVQTQTVTVHLRGLTDLGTIGGGEEQVRRIVALRAFPPAEGSGRRTRATWAWEQPVDADCFQPVDAATQHLRLWDGSLLVLSAEGVARVYELRIAGAIDTWHRLDAPVPQVEDYARP